MKRVYFRHVLAISCVMAAVISLGLCLPCEGSELNKLSEEEISDGWILLFDGETLFGWETHGNCTWKVADGALMCDTGTDGWLGTKTEFTNFILRLQYRISANGNSGIFFRADKGPQPWVTGYEMQIWDEDTNNPTGSIYNVLKAKHPGGKLVTAVEKWQDVEVVASGEHLTVTLNGHKVVDARDGRHRRGVIGVQYHYPNMKMEVRNVRLKPLRLKSIFNGKDLTGWSIIPGRRSVFSVTPESWLNIKNGNGQIETKDVWDDFVLQLDIISNGTRLNSGVFFRGDKGQFWSGYESQIRNQWEGNDRTKPVDFGTGGVYFYCPARKVVSSDREWFTKTIVAHGNHMAVWVNGYQVSEFTDIRPRGKDARRNCRLEAGPISLQGHDPTTDLSFRNIRIASYPKGKKPESRIPTPDT